MKASSAPAPAQATPAKSSRRIFRISAPKFLKSEVKADAASAPLSLPIHQLTDDLAGLRPPVDSNGEIVVAAGAAPETPYSTGFVKCVTDRWSDAHTQPPRHGSPQKVSETRESARIVEPTFADRRQSVEDGLAHLPNFWHA